MIKKEFYDKKLAQGLLKAIKAKAGKEKFSFMEVCGTHTVNIFRFGIKALLPQNIKLISGPGCPVCVTSDRDIEYVIELSKKKDVIITTFGDMVKVPAGKSSLAKARSEGSDIRIVYSPSECLDICKKNLKKTVVFFSIGFETTSPLIAATIKKARQEKIKNFFIYSANKLIPPAMKVLLESGEVNIDGFICPGHVSTIIGANAYNEIAKKYNIPCVVIGFEPLDILQGIYMLTEQAIKVRKGKKASVEIQYTRCVDRQGNKVAQAMLKEVFKINNAEWRGLGVLPGSGLKLSNKYKEFSIESKYKIKIPKIKMKKGCRCGDVLRGVIEPPKCPLFRKACTPEHPYGPCMVSVEGSCAAFYKYS